MIMQRAQRIDPCALASQDLLGVSSGAARGTARTRTFPPGFESLPGGIEQNFIRVGEFQAGMFDLAGGYPGGWLAARVLQLVRIFSLPRARTGRAGLPAE